MRALKLDFVRRSSPLRGLGFALLAAALATAAYLTQCYLQRSAELDNWASQYRHLQKTQRSRTDSSSIATAATAHLQEELKAADDVIARLAMPWDTLFSEVETSINDQVTLLSIEPDTAKRELRLTAEARDLDAMLDYVRKVQSGSIFGDAYVVSHQIQQQDPQKPVRFVLEAKWKGLSQPVGDEQSAVSRNAND
jgi:Tfp pilus assembly protein PilN